MTSEAFDTDDWLAAIASDPELTSKDILAGYYYAGADETGLSDELLQESFDKLADRGYFEPIFVLDEQASFDVRKTIPKANR